MNGENLQEQLAAAIAERNRLREAIIEASLIVGAEDMDERKWALLIGRLNDALNGREPAVWQIWRERAMNAEAERNRLRVQAERKHCLPDCGHAEHYIVVEIEIGPVPNRPWKGTPLDEFVESIAELVHQRDDVSMSATILSDEVLGHLDDETTP